MRFLIMFSILLAGCASTSKYDEQWEKERVEILAQTVAPTCPSVHTNQCGLLSDLPENSPKLFIDQYCKGKITKKCSDDYNVMMNAKYILRYPQANVERVVLQCQADPKACLTSRMIEILMRDSHNDKVFKLGELRKAEFENAIAEDKRQRSKALGEALKSMGSSMQNNRSIRCNTIGDNTFCQ